MTDCRAVVDAYAALSDGLSELAGRVPELRRRTVLRQRSAVSGELAERCDARFGEGDVPGGDAALGRARAASDAAGATDGSDLAEVDRVVAAATRANAALDDLLGGDAGSRAASRLRGVLETASPDLARTPRRTCATLQNHFRVLDHAPGFRRNQGMLDSLTREMLRQGRWSAAAFPRVIPVVVHVIHSEARDDVGDAQVASQIEALNADFGAANGDLNGVPDAFGPAVGDAGLTFVLAPVDSSGAPSSGVTRTRTDVAEFRADDAMKASATGGADAWDARRYLNVWVCRLAGGLLGYAQFPGGPVETDGVVVGTHCFGVGGRAEAPFDRGRTLTHEVGHYLNLAHIWGEDRIPSCSDSDGVDDTPNQYGPNVGAPPFPSRSCGDAADGDMFMNFMDYVDDAAMAMFTAQQVRRMHAALAFSRPELGTGMDLAAAPGPGSALVGRVWVRVPEEESGEGRVYRPEDFPIPPARGRESLLFLADGAVESTAPGRGDAPTTARGRWSADGGSASAIAVDLEGRAERLSVVELGPDRLTLI